MTPANAISKVSRSLEIPVPDDASETTTRAPDPTGGAAKTGATVSVRNLSKVYEHGGVSLQEIGRAHV